VTRDGAPSMIGKKTGFTGRIRQKINKLPSITWNFATESTNSHHVEKL
jgi:hypothetical protein